MLCYPPNNTLPFVSFSHDPRSLPFSYSHLLKSVFHDLSILPHPHLNPPFPFMIYSFCSGVSRVGVTRGGNWGCYPYFCSLKKLTTFFSHQRLSVRHYHPIFSSKADDFFPFLLIAITFIDFTRVSPPRGCHPAFFLPVRPRLCTVLCKFSHNFFRLGVTHRGCHPERSALRPPPAVTTLFILPHSHLLKSFCFPFPSMNTFFFICTSLCSLYL